MLASSACVLLSYIELQFFVWKSSVKTNGSSGSVITGSHCGRVCIKSNHDYELSFHQMWCISGSVMLVH